MDILDFSKSDSKTEGFVVSDKIGFLAVTEFHKRTVGKFQMVGWC